MEYLINSVIGAAGGWLMGQLGKGSGFGTIGNVISGVVGGNGGSLLASVLGLVTASGGDGSMGSIGSWLSALVGSSALTGILGMFNKPKAS